MVTRGGKAEGEKEKEEEEEEKEEDKEEEEEEEETEDSTCIGKEKARDHGVRIVGHPPLSSR